MKRVCLNRSLVCKALVSFFVAVFFSACAEKDKEIEGHGFAKIDKTDVAVCVEYFSLNVPTWHRFNLREFCLAAARAKAGLPGHDFVAVGVPGVKNDYTLSVYALDAPGTGCARLCVKGVLLQRLAANVKALSIKETRKVAVVTVRGGKMVFGHEEFDWQSNEASELQVRIEDTKITQRI